MKMKGFEHLLRKIELMSEEKKTELEIFLQRIIEGKLDIKELLKFEFDKNEQEIKSKNFRLKFPSSNKMEIMAGAQRRSEDLGIISKKGWSEGNNKRNQELKSNIMEKLERKNQENIKSEKNISEIKKNSIEKNIEKNMNEKNMNEKNINEKNINEKKINEKNMNEKNMNEKNMNEKNMNEKNMNEKKINEKKINEKKINEKNITVNEKNIKNINEKNIAVNEKNISEKNLKIERFIEKKPFSSISEKNLERLLPKMEKSMDFIPGNKNQLRFRIISTWGNIHNAGLTEIQLYSSNYEKILLSPLDISLKNGSISSSKSLKSLINGEYQTIEEENMWFSQMPAPPECLEICIFFDRGFELGGLSIWNYNRSLIESVKGIKEMEVLLNNELKWNGVLRKGVGNEFEEYREEIKIKEDFDFSRMKIKNNKDLKEFKEKNMDFNEKPMNFKEKPLNFKEKPNDFKEKPIDFKEKPIDFKEKQIPMNFNEKSINFTENFNEKSMNFNEKPMNFIEKAGFSKFPIEKNPEIKEKLITESPFPKQARISSAKPSKSLINTNNQASLVLNLAGNQNIEDNDPNSLEKLQYFNLTNEGRLHPGNRERFLQEEALDMQKDLQKHLKLLESNLDLKEKEDFDFDALDDLFSSSTQQKSAFLAKKNDNSMKKPEDIRKNDSISRFLPFPISELSSIPDPKFSIPSFPKGRFLTFKLASTWGDKHYIGLSGIEVFDDNAISLKIPKELIKADPSDINILPGYGKDPRTIDKVIDGIYLTSDDFHMWLAPFTSNLEHWIFMDLGSIKTISMIRIWNYNKSRIHSFRGVRKMEVFLDKKRIFDGEIKKASGLLTNCRERCEYILFTDQEKILKAIEKEDWLNNVNLNLQIEKKEEIERPGTATKEIEDLINERLGEDGRPLTSVKKIDHLKNQDLDIQGIINKNNTRDSNSINYGKEVFLMIFIDL